ncbi:MAG: tRNA guanosine(34) transglycosylase Tgt [bacterium]|nr:tRNA guanosine(34) transglycosylase Tgt [bacterium]
MFEFKLQKTSKKSRARLGILKTSHGIVETPAFVPVATQATIKTLASEDVLKTGAQLLIANTFHLHLKPGEKIVKAAGGLHTFMAWKKPLMTDSGGFQVFSLGFGRDLGVGKVMKIYPGTNRRMHFSPEQSLQSKNARTYLPKIVSGAQPQLVKIRENGVYFRSPVDGRELFLGPRESMRIQQALGADMIFAFDECTPPLSTKEYIVSALRRTHRWAKVCADMQTKQQATFGIVQGSKYRDLREESARYISSLGFSGYGIGGDLGESKDISKKILNWTLPLLDADKPRHLLGIGHIEDIESIVRQGIDLFDCIVPTHYARHGIAFTSRGRLDMKKVALLKDKRPIDQSCECKVCTTYSRAYITHLFKAHEITAMSLTTFHNLHYFNSYVAALREKIKKGQL